jgi:Dolichyl-phosphate-mannose-protein mannosyltransferase
MRSSANTGLLTSGLAITAGLLGLAVVFRPGVAIPFTLEWVLLFGLTALMVSRERDPELQKWLQRLVFGALGVRLLAALLVHFSPDFSPYFLAPDAKTYEVAGKEIARHWQGLGPAPQGVTEGWRQGYYYLNAFFYLAFEESSFALVVLNMFAGVWTVLLIFNLTKNILSVEAAKVTGILTAVFPSLVLWSILNIRDALATLFVVLMVWASTRLSSHFRFRDLVAFLAALLGLTAIRDYMGFLVLSGLALGAFAAVRPNRMVTSLLTGTVVILFLTYTAEQLELFTSVRPEELLGTAQILRSGLQANATSAFGVGSSTLTIGTSLQYLPLGASFLLFAPFPWAIETPLQLVAMPETLLWYPLFLMAIRGFWLAGRRGDLSRTMIPFSVLLVVTASYALVEGNFGTAYRHRAQVMPLFFIFSGIGISWFNARVLRPAPWSRRARAERSRRQQRQVTQAGHGP